ncbi:MAG: pilus assembly protein TadG-related protein [Hyphomicrobiaceae bacterium]
MRANIATSILRTGSTFRHNAEGTVAIIFGLSAFLLVLVTGLAIDVGRVMHAERAIASAADAAALAAAKGLKNSGMTDAEVQNVAQKFFNANMNGHGGDYTVVNSFSVNIDRNTNSVRLDIATEVPTLFGNLAGIDKISVPKTAVAIFDTKDIEVGIQLDLTGSMCMPCTKIAALKDAVAGPDGMLDILIPDSGTTNNVRIGLAPFAAAVNAGRYAGAVSDFRVGSDNCVYERRDATLQATETAPIGYAALAVKSDLPGASACPSDAEVVGLTNDKSMLKSEINRWGTGGSTAGHLGASWAWALVSPAWASIWGGTPPAAYHDGRTSKYVILMTDGIYNTTGGVNHGDNSDTAAKSQNFARDTCTAMKDQGVTVYTIGFQAPNAAKAQLKNCASSASKFFDASDAETLRAAFRAIAEEINSLRLSS